MSSTPEVVYFEIHPSKDALASLLETDHRRDLGRLFRELLPPLGGTHPLSRLPESFSYEGYYETPARHLYRGAYHELLEELANGFVTYRSDNNRLVISRLIELLGEARLQEEQLTKRGVSIILERSGDQYDPHFYTRDTGGAFQKGYVGGLRLPEDSKIYRITNATLFKS